MLLLAYLCENEIGIPKNLSRAVELNKKAAELGEPAAMDNLGLYYANGTLVTKDMNEAVEWLEKASGKGNFRATDHLAKILMDGGLEGKDDGYPKNPQRAYALGRGMQLASQEGSATYQWGAAIVQKAGQRLDSDQLIAAETEAEKVRA
jgi:TPR repeat protein